MASVLARLGGPTGDARYWKLSRGTLSAFAGTGFEGGTRDALASAWIETASGRP
jgi:hypothetical protein